MFEERYRGDNEKISPDEGLVRHLANKMSEELNPDEKLVKKRRRTRVLRSVSAVAAGAAIIFAGVGVYMNWFGGGGSGLLPPSVSAPALDRETQEKARALADTGVEAYEDVYSVINGIRKAQETSYTSSRLGGAKGAGDMVTDSAAVPEAKYSARGDLSTTRREENTSSGDDYSSTNLQVKDVDEADIIKTDGKYIYALTNDYLMIVQADKGSMRVVSRIERNRKDGDGYAYASEFYVTGDRLMVINGMQANAARGDTGSKVAYDGWYGAQNTGADVYDITDRADPKLVGKTGQSGSYISSRMVGGILYLITNHYVYSSIDEKAPESYVPSLYRGGNALAMPAADICIAPSPSSTQYVVVTALDIKNPGQHLSQKSILGAGTNIYANSKNLYVASSEYSYSEKKNGNKITHTGKNITNLMRFALEDGEITYTARGSVPGSLLNQFSMDEHDGNFRVVTTVNNYSYTYSTKNDAIYSWNSNNDTSSNALYVLDAGLKTVGKIEDVARGERVYSVRFDGKTGYFVTFRQVDPLFTVDLSDPKDPKIRSALKIPGFSEYLHPYADGLLFGFGKDADEESGAARGLKLSMFDVSNPSNVTEKDKVLLHQYGWSEASYNHKAILVSPDRSLIAFPADSEYVIYAYDRKNGFEYKASLSAEDNYGYYNVRGLYIGNIFYVFTGYSLRAYSMENYALISNLRF